MAFQMHPVLRQMKNNKVPEENTRIEMEGEGLARLQSSPERHPRVAIKKDISEAYIPQHNIIRDNNGQEAEELRDLKYNSGKEMCCGLNRKKILNDDDFELDEKTGISPARAHIGAADIVTAYEQTVNQEVNFQKAFNNHVRVLIAREEVMVGLLQLWDFVEAFKINPHSKCLTSQMLLIAQHIKGSGIFKDSFLNILEPESRWLYDLINLLQSIVVQERTLKIPEKVAAINYSVITLSKFYARKMFNSPYVPLDKEVKINTFYMRMVLKILALCDDLGVYRNQRIERVVSCTRRKEMNDEELLFNLKRTFTNTALEDLESDEEVDDEMYLNRQPYFEAHQQQHPKQLHHGQNESHRISRLSESTSVARRLGGHF
ncbi:52K [Mastadenovirus eidoli]|uniref:52K n=1 Tax=Eidolon helvum adenovirus TaxID=2039267 RepID=A0A348FKG1_9ADEN|nr:52K [Eidolon helvum adenovirus]BBF72828.1 52K [Eidolon helvum adenovirus]